jgi:hypothetical protein
VLHSNTPHITRDRNPHLNHTSSHCMAPYGTSFDCMAPYGTSFDRMALYGTSFHHMAPYGTSFRHIGTIRHHTANTEQNRRQKTYIRMRISDSLILFPEDQIISFIQLHYKASQLATLHGVSSSPSN